MTILTSTTAWCQVTVTGKVVFKDDNSAAPGVDVLEKGTKNGTTTDKDGTFSITVTDPNATLVFLFIGIGTQEVQLNGKKEIFIKLEVDCYKDFFDSKQVHIYANSGLVNNPIGGQIDIASPWIFRGVIKGSYSYQTNLDENEFQNGHIELSHYISNCDFDIDFRWSHRQASFENDFRSKANSFETDLNLRGLKIIAGYTNLDLNKKESVEIANLSGLLIGFGQYFNIPLHPTAIAKVSIYKNKVEYQASIQGGHKRFLCSIKFYKLDNFNELSFGAGIWLGYRIKKREG